MLLKKLTFCLCTKKAKNEVHGGRGRAKLHGMRVCARPAVQGAIPGAARLPQSRPRAHRATASTHLVG